MMQRQQLDERRVFRQIALPISAFDVLQDLKRAWKLETNAEVLTRLLLGAGRTMLKSDEANADDRTRRPH